MNEQRINEKIRQLTDDELDRALASAYGDDYDELDAEWERRYQERESRRRAHEHALWKGQHNRRLHNGGY